MEERIAFGLVISLLLLSCGILTMVGLDGVAKPVPLADTEPPTFSNLVIDPSPETGGSSTFSIDVSDDVKVNSSSVMMVYEGSTDGSPQIIMMSWDSGDTYTCGLTIDDYWTGIRFNFTANDTSDNVGWSDDFKSDVKDVIDPTISSDYSDGIGYTGDEFWFIFDVVDNIAVTSMEVKYWFGSGSDQYLYPDISDGGSGETQTCSAVLDIPTDSVDQLHYQVNIEDAEGNSDGPSTTIDIDVLDNDPPSFSTINLDTDPVTGGSCTISVMVTDNIDLVEDEVILYYRDENTKSFSSVTMTETSSDWFDSTIDIDTTWIELYYYISASDASDNIGSTSTRSSYVHDVILPDVLEDRSDTEAFTGNEFDLSFKVWDNTYIEYAEVSYWFGSDGTDYLTMSVPGPCYGSDVLVTGLVQIPSDSLSDLNYYIDVYDRDWNWAGSSTVTISPVDDDPPGLEMINNTDSTTGDPFHFEVSLNDNIDGIHVPEAYVNYCYGSDWSNSMNLTLDFQAGDDVWTSPEFNIDEFTPGPLSFYVTAVDEAGNWMNEGPFTQPVIDNDDPDYTWPDVGPVSGTTGDIVSLTLKSGDNIGISQVMVIPSYADGARIDPLILTENPKGTFKVDLTLSNHTISDLTYHYLIYDTSNNIVQTPDRTISVSDNDNPEPISDMSAKQASAGSEYYFKTILHDNIQIKTGWVEYWFSYDTNHIRVEMDHLSGELYYYRIQLNFRAGSLFYAFDCEDIYGHRSGNTVTKQVLIIDSVSPIVSDLTHTDTATTGDVFQISAVITDDVDLEGVRLGYFYSDNPDEIKYLTGSNQDDLFSFGIDVEDRLDSIEFWIEATDKVGNPTSTGLSVIPITDNDQPVISEDGSDTTSSTGDPFRFEFFVVDNIAVRTVTITYTLTGLDPVTIEPVQVGGSYAQLISVPNQIKGTLTYSFTAVDSSGNLVVTEPVEIDVLDDELPIPVIIGPTIIDQHMTVTFSGQGSTDNVGIETFTWFVAGQTVTGPVMNFTFDIAGDYIIELYTDDGTNPATRTTLALTVRDIDRPVIDLVVPDEIGNHLRLVANATGSTDNVGIASFSWKVILPGFDQVIRSGPVLDLDLNNILGEVYLHLTVRDEAGNSAEVTRMIQVKDLMAPTIIPHSNLTIVTGDRLTFSDLGSTDNIGISEYRWSVSGPENTRTLLGHEMIYYFSRSGEYKITLTLIDSSGNEAIDEFTVTVQDPDASTDSDSDGIPDIWEMDHGLDRLLDDAKLDPDSDTISNLDEYLHGTDPKNLDTDGDGLPDDWEIMFGFDPVTADNSSGDPDNDGITNIDEYIHNTDPTAVDKEQTRWDPTYLALGSVIVAVVALVLILIAMGYYLTNVQNMVRKKK